MADFPAKRLQQYWHDQGFKAACFWAELIGVRFSKIREAFWVAQRHSLENQAEAIGVHAG